MLHLWINHETTDEPQTLCGVGSNMTTEPAEVTCKRCLKKLPVENGGVPFDHWGAGCPADCPIPEHKR